MRSQEDGSSEGGGAEGEGAGDAPPMSLADLMPKVDISGQIKGDLIKELADKNWKIRGEALQKVQDIIAQAKFVQPSLGDLPGALKGRLTDSNKNLVRKQLVFKIVRLVHYYVHVCTCTCMYMYMYVHVHVCAIL